MQSAWRARTALAAVAVSGIVCSILGWTVLRENERRTIEGEFVRDAQNVISLIRLEFVTVEESVRGLSSFFRASREVDEGEFSEFLGGPEFPLRDSAIQAFYYAAPKSDSVYVEYVYPEGSKNGGCRTKRRVPISKKRSSRRKIHQ